MSSVLTFAPRVNARVSICCPVIHPQIVGVSVTVVFVLLIVAAVAIVVWFVDPRVYMGVGVTLNIECRICNTVVGGLGGTI